MCSHQMSGHEGGRPSDRSLVNDDDTPGSLGTDITDLTAARSPTLADNRGRYRTRRDGR